MSSRDVRWKFCSKWVWPSASPTTDFYFTDAKALPQTLVAVIDATRAKGVLLNVLAIGANQAVAGADACLHDADGHIRQLYGVPAHGAAYLLRPDQHVCARWLTLDATRLQAALHTALPQ